MVEALSWWSRRASQHPAVQSPVHPWKSPTNLARSPLLAALVRRNKTVVRHQFFPQNLPVQACDSRAQGFSPPLARRRSSCPPPSSNLVLTYPIEHYQALRDNSAPCLSRAATLPKGTKLELRRGAHLGIPSSTNHTTTVSQPIGWIAMPASWLNLLRVSPALNPPERPSHTHTPKPDFGGRGHEVYFCQLSAKPLDDRYGVTWLSSDSVVQWFGRQLSKRYVAGPIPGSDKEGEKRKKS